MGNQLCWPFFLLSTAFSSPDGIKSCVFYKNFSTVNFFFEYLTFSFICANIIAYAKAVTKPDLPGKIPREDVILLQDIRIPAPNDTTSEPPVGNLRTGAPVKAPMSDGQKP